MPPTYYHPLVERFLAPLTSKTNTTQITNLVRGSRGESNSSDSKGHERRSGDFEQRLHRAKGEA